jgi:hypothetical protein
MKKIYLLLSICLVTLHTHCAKAEEHADKVIVAPAPSNEAPAPVAKADKDANQKKLATYEGEYREFKRTRLGTRAKNLTPILDLTAKGKPCSDVSTQECTDALEIAVNNLAAAQSKAAKKDVAVEKKKGKKSRASR